MNITMVPMVKMRLAVKGKLKSIKRINLFFSISIPVVAFTCAFLVYFLRRPDALINAQFWAEEGLGYQQALESGSMSWLFVPDVGNIHATTKLVLWLATFFPMEYAPLFMNFTAMLICAAPIGFLFSQRMNWISWQARLLVTLYYLLMPQLTILEVHGNINNTFWYLSLYCILTVIANPPKTLSWKIHDIFILIPTGLSSLAGVVFVFPCFIMKIWQQSISDNNLQMRAPTVNDRLHGLKRELLRPYSLLYLSLCLIQGWAVATTASTGRSLAPLGLSDSVLIDILSSRVFLGALLPMKWIGYLCDQHFLNYTMTMLGVLGIIYLLRLRDYRITGVILFAGIMLAACLAKPMLSLDAPQLPLLLKPLGGGRYFFVPCLVWFCLLVRLMCLLHGRWRALAFTAMALVVITVGVQEFRLRALPDLNFKDYVKKYKQLPQGEKIVIPINPGGAHWKIEIIKK